MQENSMSMQQYFGLLGNDQLVDLLRQPCGEVGRDSDIPNTVTATLMISFEQIRKQYFDASDLLSLMSFLSPEENPRAIGAGPKSICPMLTMSYTM